MLAMCFECLTKVEVVTLKEDCPNCGGKRHLYTPVAKKEERYEN